MKTSQFKLLLSFTIILSEVETSCGNTTNRSVIATKDCDTQSCPTWFTCNSENHCECGDTAGGMIACDNGKLISAIRVCHCATYDRQTNSTYAGTCFYNCNFMHHSAKIYHNVIYRELPREPLVLLNASACTYFHRTGLLCGECEPGHSPLVLSYNLGCVECPDGHKNWWKFVVAAFLPLTLFYFFVVFFSINVTSSRLHGVVWFGQTFSTPIFVRSVFHGLSVEKSWWQLSIAKGFCIFFSCWNLELFYSVYPDICLNISTLQALALQYLVALYPYLLILISYIIIRLYDKNFKPVVLVLKPLKKLLTKLRISWDIRTSVIDSFATFFLLSYFKILCVSSDILVPTEIYQLGRNETTLGLYYSPTVEYFGKEHCPYAILALVILSLFVLLPTVIIIFYPCGFFQKALSLFPFNWHFLHAFVDSYQGCYKDGTERGTYDCRWFSAVMLLHRIPMFFVFGVTLSMMYYIYASIVIVILLIAMINIEPFKKAAVNFHLTNSIFFFLLCICYLSLTGRQIPVARSEPHSIQSNVLVIQALLSGLLPILYTLYLVGSWLISRIRLVA